MRHVMMILAALLAMSSTTVLAADISKDASDRIQQASARADGLATGKVAEYAKEYLEAAKESILIAKQTVATGGSEKMVLQRTDLAQLQMTVAEAKAGVKELSEEVALCRAEMKRLEAQLERYTQPEEK